MSIARLTADLGMDIAAITALVTMYFLRHRRRDLVLAYTALNVGVFVVVAMLAAQRVDFAVGFGLFGILSIIRLRSSSITQEEVGYYFVALALGLVNGLSLPNIWVALLLDGVLIAAMYAAGHRRLLSTARSQTVILDVVHTDEAALRADLERRLGGTVTRLEVSAVDFVQETTTVDVRYRSSQAPQPAAQLIPHRRMA